MICIVKLDQLVIHLNVDNQNNCIIVQLNCANVN